MKSEQGTSYSRDSKGRFNSEPRKDFRREKTRELGYLIGVWKGDGYIKKDKHNGRNYSLKLSTVSPTFIERFCECVKKIGLTPSTTQRKPSKKSYTDKTVLIASACSIKFVEFLEGIELKEFIDSKEIKKGFIEGYFDSDGSTGVYADGSIHEIRLSSQDKNLLETANDFLKDFGYGFNLGDYSKEYVLKSSDREDYVRFHDEINPKVKCDTYYETTS